MTQDPSIHGVGAAQGPSPGGGSQRTSGGGTAFRVLLERLEGGARRLQESGDSPLAPEELAGAVDRARATLDDALSLGDQILEAYRAAVQRDEPEEGDPHERRDP